MWQECCWLQYFYQPAVKSKASRDHRIFGGFSLGSVTTWLEFCYDYDYIKYFIPMSGSSWYYGGYGDFQIERNVDFIEQLVKDNELELWKIME